MSGSSDRLTAELEKLSGVPPRMIERARRGYYDEFGSPSQTPQADLYAELTELGQTALATRVTNGEFLNTLQEARQWLKSSEGARAFREMFPAISRDRWKEILGL